MQSETLGTSDATSPGFIKRVTIAQGNIYIYVTDGRPNLSILDSHGKVWCPEMTAKLPEVLKNLGLSGNAFVWTNFLAGTHFHVNWSNGPWNGHIVYHGHQE